MAVMFFMFKLNQEQKEYLLALARESIEKYFELGDVKKVIAETVFSEERLFLEENGACFVTLTISGKLRGCIGSIEAFRPLIIDIIDNAINAAFFDPRFAPMTKEEFLKTKTEISILTKPESLNFSSPEELLKKLRPGKDGVIIKKGGRKATFLPQVWEELPDKEDFLSHLCLKARLNHYCWQNPICWQEDGVEVLTYGVESFKQQ